MMHSGQESKIPLVNTKLNSASTRIEGLNLLCHNFPSFSNETLLQYTNLWISKAVQELENINNTQYSLNIICKAIGLLVISSKEIPELNKQISMQYVKQLINIITNLEFDRRSGGTYYLISVLLHYYPEACERLQMTIKKVLLATIDTDNKNLVESCAKCYTLLAKATERSFTAPAAKPNYNGYIFDEYILCNTLHVIMTELFDIPDTESSEKSDVLDLPNLSDTNIYEYYNSLKHRFINICTFLSRMLKTRIKKASVCQKDIIQLLCRGLSFTPETVKRKEEVVGDIIIQILPELHISLLGVMHSFFQGFRCDIFMPIPIFQLIQQVLNWTDEAIDEGGLSIDHLALLRETRILAYESIISWFKYCELQLNNDSLIEKFVNHILKDISPDKKRVFLSTQNKLHMSKRARKSKNQQLAADKFNNNPNESSDLPRWHADSSIQGLRVLQEIYSRNEFVMFPHLYEKMTSAIIQLSETLYLGTEPNDPYRLNSQCRLELLKTLRCIMTNPNPQKSTPTTDVIRILQRASNDHDQNIIVEVNLSKLILEKIIHPSSPSINQPYEDEFSNSQKRNLDKAVKAMVAIANSKQQKHLLLETTLLSEIEEKEGSENTDNIINNSKCDNESDKTIAVEKQNGNSSKETPISGGYVSGRNYSQRLRNDIQIDLTPSEGSDIDGSSGEVAKDTSNEQYKDAIDNDLISNDENIDDECQVINENVSKSNIEIIKDDSKYDIESDSQKSNSSYFTLKSGQEKSLKEQSFQESDKNREIEVVEMDTSDEETNEAKIIRLFYDQPNEEILLD